MLFSRVFTRNATAGEIYSGSFSSFRMDKNGVCKEVICVWVDSTNAYSKAESNPDTFIKVAGFLMTTMGLYKAYGSPTSTDFAQLTATVAGLDKRIEKHFKMIKEKEKPQAPQAHPTQTISL